MKALISDQMQTETLKEGVTLHENYTYMAFLLRVLLVREAKTQKESSEQCLTLALTSHQCPPRWAFGKLGDPTPTDCSGH